MAQRALKTITLGNLLDTRFPIREDLVFPWLRQGESAMLWAAAGTGKTLLALTVALMVAGGGEALGWVSAKPRKVLFVDGETAASDLRERAEWLMDTISGIDKAAAASNLLFLSRNMQNESVAFPDLNDREGRHGATSGQDEILGSARRHCAELLILDNFATLAEVADENDAAAMSPTLAFLLRAKQGNLGCILVHHSGKDGTTYRGSSRLATTFEVIIGLRQLDSAPSQTGAAFRIEWTKYRREPNDAIRSRDVTLCKSASGKSQWVAQATSDDDVSCLLAAVETCKFPTQVALAEHLGWDASKVSRMKMRAITSGRITQSQWEMHLAEADATPDDF